VRCLAVAIGADNGVPSASPNGLINLSKLAVWWLRLGIAIERIKPVHPQQNCRHECMHRTLNEEAARPPAANALALQRPADVYTPSPRRYRGLSDIEYPLHGRDGLVTACGRICLHWKNDNQSTVLSGQRVALKKVGDAIGLVSFMTYDLGYIDLEQWTLHPATGHSACGCYPCLRYKPSLMSPGRSI